MTQSRKEASKPESRDDHYVPQTYLKHFCDDQNDPNFVWRYWKNNPHKQNPKTHGRVSYKGLCSTEGGDYNPHFLDNRPLDEYFKLIENPYNEALRSFENGDYNVDAKVCIARNVARMRIWSPKRKGLVKLA